MDVQLGLSLLLLLFHINGALSKNIRDGPNNHPRYSRRAAGLNEFLVPPPPSSDHSLPVLLSTNLAPPPFPPRIRGPTRDSRHVPKPTQESPAYISRLMDWLNPFKLIGGKGNGGSIPQQNGVLHQQYGPPPTSNQHGPPKNEYGPPQNQYGSPQNQYGLPQNQYGPPQQQFNSPQNQYGSPKNQYGSPPQQSAPPPQQYGSPPQQHVPPQNQYGPPQQQHVPPQNQYGPPQQHYGPPSSFNPPTSSQQLPTSNFPNFQPSNTYKNPQSIPSFSDLTARGKTCNPCNAVPWMPIHGQKKMSPSSHQNNFANNGPTNNYLPPPLPIPAQSYPSSPNIQRPSSEIDSYPTYTHTQSSIANPVLNPGPVPPIYKAQNFHTPPPNFDLSGSGNDYSSDNFDNHPEVYPEPISSETGSDTKTVPRQSSVGGHIDFNGNDIKDNTNNLEVIPSYGSKLSSEEIHFQQSPVIDINDQVTSQNPPLAPVNNAHGTSASPNDVSIADYIVSSYDESEVTTQKLPSTTKQHRWHAPPNPTLNVKEIIREDLNGYYIRRDNDSFSDSSIESFATPIYQQVKKKNRQVQIIIPYTSQHTPSPFNPLIEDLHDSASSKVYVKDSSNAHSDKVDDNVVGQESQSIQVKELPHNGFYITRPIDGSMHNNSIDVQRLQKNIDNWTIEEYSSGTTSSSILHNSSHPYLSQSKKIPHEYLTTSEPNVTVNSHESLVDESTISYGLDDYDASVVSTTQVPSTDASTESVENSTQVQIVEGRPWSSAEMEQFWQTVPSTSKESEKVFVVTSRTISPSEFGDSRTKKKSDDIPKKKKKKKSYEPIERAYQVLPQAVNDLAVASTGPENIPLWGIMEHEDFTVDHSTKKLQNATENLSPMLFVGHSKVSRASR